MIVNRIRQARIANGLTQWQLAALCGVGTRAVQKWEWGRSTPMNLATWCKLANVLHVNVNWLMGEDVMNGKDDEDDRQ